jgi:hypothetical protein
VPRAPSPAKGAGPPGDRATRPWGTRCLQGLGQRRWGCWHLTGLVAAGLVAACDATAADETPPTLEIGTGTWRFEPVPNGASLPLVRGAQGGWHLWVAVRLGGVPDDTGSIEIAHFPTAAPESVARTTHGVHLDPPNADGLRAYLGWPAVVADPACAVGHPYRVEIAFRPASGGRLSARLDVDVTPGDDPPPPCPH